MSDFRGAEMEAAANRDRLVDAAARIAQLEAAHRLSLIEQGAEINRLKAALRDDPTPEQIYNACMSYRHDFGLLPVEDRRAVVFDATQWLRAWQKALERAALGEERT